MQKIFIIVVLSATLLLAVSIWNYTTLKRLKNASLYFTDSQAFEDTCHVSKEYVKEGFILSQFTLVVSLILFFVSWIIWLKE